MSERYFTVSVEGWSTVGAVSGFGVWADFSSDASDEAT